MESAIAQLDVFEAEEWVDVPKTYGFCASDSGVRELVIEARDGDIRHLYMGTSKLFLVYVLPYLDRSGDSCFI